MFYLVPTSRSDTALAMPDSPKAIPLGRIQDILGLDWITFKARFDRLYCMLNGLDLLLVRMGP